MSTVATISAVAGKKGLAKIIDDIYDTSKGQLRMRFKRWKAKKNIDVIYKKIKNIRKVKTILQPEKAVDLLKFYYPCKVKKKDKRVTIRDISQLNLDGNIVIKGTVGQGKSIFFRYLASKEMLKGKKVPIFVEFRRIQKGESLMNHLIDEADALGMRGIDKETFLWLAEEGKVVLLLDAFDEVPESERTRITNEIERLAKKYEKLQILISSRPNSGIENSPLFQVFEMAPLEGQEYEEAIGVMAEESVATNIVKTIRNSRSPVRELLTTPLMVALLIVRHRIEQAIPENLIGFYQGLFGLLISRHDRMKGGYTRTRKSGLGDTALEEVFEGICFLTRKERKGDFVRKELNKYAKESARLTGHKCVPDNVIEDIIKITCLILEDGDEYKFIQKSVQEYHAACFIKNQPDEITQRFYSYNTTKNENNFGLDEYWQEELRFLQMIDKYRFLKCYFNPAISAMFGVDESKLPARIKITQDLVFRVFDGICLDLDTDEPWGILVNSPLGSRRILLSLLQKQIWEYISLLDAIEVKEAFVDNGIGKLRFEGFSVHKFREWAENTLNQIHSELLQAREYIERVEARREIFEF